jgi:aquaporin Z
MKQWQKYLAELLGTFVLVFGGSLAILTFKGGSGTDVVTVIAFGFGLSLLAALYAFGEVSGGHFNPILSLAMFLDRRLTALETIWYWIAQFVGAILASLLILITYASTNDVGLTANRTSNDARAFVLEIVMSAIFAAVVLQVTRSGVYGASTLLAIPLTLVAIHFALIGNDSAGVNPARSFAPVLLSGDYWSDVWIFLLAPPIGAVIGWVAHMITVRGDTALGDDLRRAAGDMRSVEMRGIRQGPGQVPPQESPPPSPPES